jgi:hypothetical protein
MLVWLSSLNFFNTQDDNLARRQEGTGQWFLDAEAFKHWVNNRGSILWCSGIRKLHIYFS